MKTRAEVTAEKLRGGFYTPPELVEFCLARVQADLSRASTVLEPSAGDGAFATGLGAGGFTHLRLLGLEPFDLEAEKARQALRASGLSGEVRTESAIQWAASSAEQFDVAVGNPPFVRYQFVSRADREAATELADRLGLSFGGVSNLWIPVLLGALSRVREGGAFSFVIPTECFTGVSARVVRDWLTRTCGNVRFDLFLPGSFPGVLQEVTVLSGRRAAESRTAVDFVDHSEASTPRTRRHRISAAATTWTRYLLEPTAVAAIQELEASSSAFTALREVASFTVSTVTGANDFFAVSTEAVESNDLGPWSRPLVGRLRHAPGLRFGREDHHQLASGEAAAWLLDFSAARPDPTANRAAKEYLQLGEDRKLHERYKCRIRDPWYRVPIVEPGELLLSKRSHRYPRMVVNEAGAVTTDTIYQARLQSDLPAGAIAAGFHNSFTLLAAELGGRSFGGGVLELVPSEIAGLPVPADRRLEAAFGDLDQCSRVGAGDDALVLATNEALASHSLVELDVMAVMEAARQELLERRLLRNRKAAAAARGARSSHAA